MNTDYAAPVFGVAPAGVDMSQMFLAPTYAHKIAGTHALGVSRSSPTNGSRHKGSRPSALLERPRQPHGQGPRELVRRGRPLGYLGNLLHWLSVGASYQSRIHMSRPSTKYRGLFAEQGGFDIPQTWTAGVAVKPADRLSVVFDVQWINYARVRSVGNDFLPNLALAPLGTDQGAGFGWHDMTVYKGGLRLRGPRLDLRGRLFVRPAADPRQRGADQHPGPGRHGAAPHRRE